MAVLERREILLADLNCLMFLMAADKRSNSLTVADCYNLFRFLCLIHSENVEK